MSITDILRTARERAGFLPFVGALVAWTLLWTVLGVQDVLTQSDIGTGLAGETIDLHEVMQLVFVAAYAGIRWLVGMVILCLGGAVVWWGERRLARRQTMADARG